MKASLKPVLVFALCAALLMVGLTAASAEIIDSSNCGANGDNLTWTLDSTGLLTIRGTGAMADYSVKDETGRYITTTPWGMSPSRIVIEPGVTSIGKYAFFGCFCLTSVSIPNGVTSIGRDAFGSCNNLTSIIVSENNTAFAAFEGALYNKSLTTLLQYPAGKNNVILAASITSISDYAFYGCSGLTSVTIPGSVTSIATHAFAYCYGLSSVSIGNGVTNIGDAAFYYCIGLTSVTIPNSVTSIGERAFTGCVNLTISGYAGSAAEAYAADHRIPFVALR